MKIAKILIALGAVTGLLAFVSPANAQMRANHGGNVNRGHFRDFDHDHDRDHFRGRVFFAAGFGFPFFYSYPYWGYPYYYGYPYGYYGYPYYGYPGYGYDVNGAYAGRTAGAGNDNSMTIQVQRQLAAAGYYHGAIDGV